MNNTLGQLAWEAYAESAKVSFQGKPLPKWEELGDRQQEAWEIAAETVASRVLDKAA